LRGKKICFFGAKLFLKICDEVSGAQSAGSQFIVNMKKEKYAVLLLLLLLLAAAAYPVCDKFHFNHSSYGVRRRKRRHRGGRA
jgi:hypothetical protein